MNAKWFIRSLAGSITLLLIALTLASHGATVNAQATQAATMAPAPVAAVVQNWVDAWNSLKVDAVVAVFTKDGVYEDVPTGKVSKGSTEIGAFAQFFFTAVPDLHIDLVNSWVQGGHGEIEWVFSGTDKGIYKTGKKFSLRGATVLDTNADGTLITRDVDYYDFATLMRQIGVLPAGM